MSDQKSQPDGVGSPHYVAYLLMKQIHDDSHWGGNYKPMSKDEALDLYVECYKAVWGTRPSKKTDTY